MQVKVATGESGAQMNFRVSDGQREKDEKIALRVKTIVKRATGEVRERKKRKQGI